MKKLIILIPLIVISCKKESAISENVQNDSLQKTEVNATPKVDSSAIKDSLINNSPITKEVLRTGVNREVEGNKIIRNSDISQLPFTIGEEFTEEGQEFVLKIKDFAKEDISVKVTPKNPDMNIRINQIKQPNGSFDGPFGRNLDNYEVTEKGEVWIIIGRSNMASGESKGNFTVSVE